MLLAFFNGNFFGPVDRKAFMCVFIRSFALGFAVYWGAIGTSQAGGIFALANPADNGQTLQGYVAARAFGASDHARLLELSAVDPVRYAPRAGNNVSLASASVETGVQWQGYRLAAVSRSDAYLSASRDTVDLINQYANALGYDNPRKYAVAYQIRAFEADGLKFSRSLQFDAIGGGNLKAGLGVSYLRGRSLKLENIKGQAVTLNTKDFDAALTQSISSTWLDTQNLSQFNAPFGRQERFSGDGYAVDAGVTWLHLATGMRMELAIADLFGEMRWNNIPTNVATLSTATKSYDANGFVQYDPTTTRTSSYKSVSMTLEPKVYLGAGIPWKQMMLKAGTSYSQGEWLPQLGIERRLPSGWTLGADIETRFSTLGVSLSCSWLQLKLRTDDLNLSQAKALGISLQSHMPF